MSTPDPLTAPLTPPLTAPPMETTPRLTVHHARRLRAIYRSAGWPCLDTVEIELLVAGMLERITASKGPEYLRVTDAGLAYLHRTLEKNRSAMDAHEALVDRVAVEMVRQGRIAYQGLTLLSKPAEQWLHLKPDVYSIRNTTREDYVEPVIHEIKVSRADLKTDLKKPEKRAGYIALSAECYYVLAAGVGQAEDVPPECGVILETPTGLEMARVSPKRAMTLGFSTWMVLAKSRRVQTIEDQEPML